MQTGKKRFLPSLAPRSQIGFSDRAAREEELPKRPPSDLAAHSAASQRNHGVGQVDSPHNQFFRKRNAALFRKRKHSRIAGAVEHAVHHARVTRALQLSAGVTRGSGKRLGQQPEFPFLHGFANGFGRNSATEADQHPVAVQSAPQTFDCRFDVVAVIRQQPDLRERNAVRRGEYLAVAVRKPRRQRCLAVKDSRFRIPDNSEIPFVQKRRAGVNALAGKQFFQPLLPDQCVFQYADSGAGIQIIVIHCRPP